MLYLKKQPAINKIRTSVLLKNTGSNLHEIHAEKSREEQVRESLKYLEQFGNPSDTAALALITRFAELLARPASV